MLSVGSEPMDKKQTMGVRFVLSTHMASMSRTTPSANCNPPYFFTPALTSRTSLPMASAMYCLAMGIVRSGHQQRISSSLWKVPRADP